MGQYLHNNKNKYCSLNLHEPSISFAILVLNSDISLRYKTHDRLLSSKRWSRPGRSVTRTSRVTVWILRSRSLRDPLSPAKEWGVLQQTGGRSLSHSNECHGQTSRYQGEYRSNFCKSYPSQSLINMTSIINIVGVEI